MLPNDFIELVKELYNLTEEEINSIFSTVKPTTFRVNTIKSSTIEVLAELKKANIEVKPGPFKNSFIVLNDNKQLISKTNLVTSGKIYMQELSSMIPPIILDPKQTDYIADLTSAPGSKTTQICALTNNKANILANEKSYIRFQKLKFNLNLQGCTNVKTTNLNAIDLPKKYKEFENFFDKILLDTPCSSEGRFNINKPKSYKYWNKNKIREMVNIQRALLGTAVKMLKPGGTLVYSTCTINVFENEENINWALQKYKNIKLLPININLKNVSKGFTKYNDTVYKNQLINTLRVLPNNNFGAFFIAKLTKQQ